MLGFNKKLGDIREALSETLSEAMDSENDIVTLSLEPFDTAHIATLIKTENGVFNKVMVVFAVLVGEMQKLKHIAETKYYGPLSLFGHVAATSAAESKDGGASSSAAAAAGGGAAGAPAKAEPIEQQMGKFLWFMQDLSNFIRRVNAVVRNTVAQLACLFNERLKIWIATFKNVELDSVFESLAETCTVLVTIDELVRQNVELANAWLAYKRMMKYARADPDKYRVDADKLTQLDILIASVDERLMSSSAFGGLLAQDYSLPDPQNPAAPSPATSTAASATALVASNRVLSQTFTEALARLFLRIKASLAEPMETYDRTKVVDLLSMYALYRSLFRSTVKVDMKLFKSLWEIQLKVPMVSLFGRAVWFVADFLVSHAPASDASSLRPAPKEVVRTRKDLLAELDEGFQGEVQELYLQLSIWMVRVESELIANKDHAPGALLNARAKLVIHGLLLANKIRTLLLTSIKLRLALNVPFQSRNTRALAQCVEMLKAIELTYRRRATMVADNINHMLGQTQYTLRHIFAPIRDKLDKRDRLNDTKADLHAAVTLALSVLEQAPTPSRRCVLHLALAVAQMKLVLKEDYEKEVRYQLWKLEKLASYQESVNRLCHVSVLYWVPNLVPHIMADIADHPDQTHRLQYILAALRDCSAMLRACAPTPAIAQQLVAAYEKEVRDSFKTSVIDPLARKVETDLRLHIHSFVLQQESLRANAQTDLSTFLGMKPVRMFDQIMDIREQVTNYLDATFYNLNTVAQHDAKVYAQMRNLAREKFGLQLAEVHLPGSAHYSEALDVLEIMRNIHVFVARYNYSVNTQVFVERAVDQKHLNVIDVLHIANSIRTHGMGIMNTTVNFTYQVRTLPT